MRIGLMLVFVLLMNVFIFLAQEAVINTNADGNVFFPYSESWASEYDTGNFSLDTNPSNVLPDTVNTGEASGNIFTDSWNTLKNWFTQSTRGLGFLGRMISGPYNLLMAAQLPAEISFIIGFFWNVLSVFLIIAFIRGGSSL